MASTTVIEVRDVSKSFDRRPVLDGISFSAGRGEIFGFLGPNGAGKTTTLRILLGLIRPDSGEARVLGRDLRVDDQARAKVGVLFENNGLVERFTARENLVYYGQLYGIESPEQRASELLEYTGLADRAGDLVGTFSTGMKRKLGLARAILHRPEILFLDEPSSGLDPEGQRMVHDLIVGLSDQSMTIFLNSHNLDEVSRICSRVAILHWGRIQACDSVESLREGTTRNEIAIQVSDPGDLGKVVLLLNSLGDGTTATREGDHLVVTLPAASSAGVIRSLVNAGIGVEEVTRRRRSLEDIYLEVVRQSGEQDRPERRKTTGLWQGRRV